MWPFENSIFYFLDIFNWWSWNQFLEKGFGASLSSRIDIAWVWNKHFLLFYKFLIGKVETIFWESKEKCSKLFKSKFGHRKLHRKLLWSDLEIKIECPEHMKMSIFSFVQFLSDKNEAIFWENAAKHQKLFKQNLILGTFLQDAFEASLNSRMNIVDVCKKYILVFCNFLIDEVEKPYLWKRSKVFKTI